MGGCRMGSYLNPGSKGFQESLNSEIYVDKTGLIEKTNLANVFVKSFFIDFPIFFWKKGALN